MLNKINLIYKRNIMYNLVDDVAEYTLQQKELTPYENMSIWRTRWKEELGLFKKAAKTIKSYHFALETFFSFATENPGISIDKIGAKYINRYLISYQIILAKKSSLAQDINLLTKESKQTSVGKNDANFTILTKYENTLSQRVTVIKMFLKFISENNKEQHDFTRIYDGIARVKIQDRFTHYLTVKELEEVVAYMQIWPEIFKDHKPKSSSMYAYRDALLLLIYALSGARSEEVVYIKLQDISLYEKNGTQRYIIKIQKGKGGKNRSIAIKKEYLEKYIEYFTEVLPDDSYYLSSTYIDGYTNKTMSPNTIRKFSNTILKQLGIQKTGLHAFRRGYVTKRIGEDEMDVSIVAKEVGNTIDILEKHYLKHSAEAFAH